MSKRISDEERIVEFFTNANVDKAETVLNIVNGIMRTRKPTAKRKSGTKKNHGAGTDTGTAPFAQVGKAS